MVLVECDLNGRFLDFIKWNETKIFLIFHDLLTRGKTVSEDSRVKITVFFCKTKEIT